MADTLWLPGGVPFEIHLGGAQTAGSMFVFVDHPPPGWSLPPHRHRTESETIHVMEGVFEMLIDGARLLLGPGDTAHVPMAVVHSGGNIGSEPGKRLVVFSPAQIEGWFREFGSPDPDAELDGVAALAAAGRFGWEFVAPTGDA